MGINYFYTFTNVFYKPMPLSLQSWYNVLQSMSVAVAVLTIHHLSALE